MSSTTATATTASATGSSASAQITPGLSTTFSPSASTCTEHRLTMLANRQYEIWMNIPVPVPGSTFADCYPSQYITSYLQAAGGITQAAFDPLVCPQDYTSFGPFTSNYIACCPSAYSFANPTANIQSDRPAYGGTCYSPISSSKTVIVTAYGSSGVTATTTFSASVTNAQAYAYPYEGYASGVAEVASLTTTSTASGATATAAATHTILADTDPVFTPNSVSAAVGDSLLFLFESGNHSITQSTFDSPCSPLTGGFDSGYLANIDNKITPTPQYIVNVTNTNSEWFYSKAGTDCAKGMVFALNPSASQSITTFRSKALATASKSSGTSTAVKAGVSVGVIAGVGLLLAIALFFYRRRRTQQLASRKAEEDEMKQASHPSPHAAGEGAWGGGGGGGEAVAEGERPKPPPKGEELHGISRPSELGSVSDPVEMSANSPWSEGRHELHSSSDPDEVQHFNYQAGQKK